MLVVVTAAAFLAAGCGGSGGDPSAPAAPPELSDNQAPPQRLTVDVTIEGGQVTPTNAQLQASVKEPILLRVSSDARDQLHVHSTPEHTFDVEAEPGQSFQFTVDVPGKVDIELHELNRTVATIVVR